jgi:carbon starvation protein
MMLTTQQSEALLNKPNLIYAQGLARFLDVLHIPTSLAIGFGLLAFTTFVYDTLDVCTRLGRFIIQELLGLRGASGRWAGTIITTAAPMYFLLTTPLGPDGKPIPAWKTFWNLFGASNQLLAALALIGITVWLWRTYRARWVWLVTGLPTLLMYVMSAWALGRFIRDGFSAYWKTHAWTDLPSNPVPWVAIVLIALVALLAIEAVMVFFKPPAGPRERTAIAAPA